jgi:quercetin dioxygenase-like cupin family protein
MSNSVTFESAQDSDSLWVVRDQVRFRGTLHGTNIELIEVEVPPGAGTPLHYHASPEIFRVLSGEITFMSLKDGSEQQNVAREGDVIRVPSNVPHGYVNMSKTPARVLAVLESSMVDFFRELGSPVQAFGPPTPEELGRVGAACAKYGISMAQSGRP